MECDGKEVSGRLLVDGRATEGYYARAGGEETEGGLWWGVVQEESEVILFRR